MASLTLFAIQVSADDHKKGDWQYAIEPYVLATSISGDTSAGRVAGVPVDVDFSDILENLEMAGMLHFEAAHRSGWGLILDYGFMDLGADKSVALGGILDAGVKQGILEAIATRQIDVNSGSLEALAGIRRWDNKVKVSLDPMIWSGSVSKRIDEDWIDPVVGLRWTTEFAQDWRLRMRGDIGGFGVGADFTWSASATAIYGISDRFELEFGYRALDVDYDNEKGSGDGRFVYDTTTHGPLVGLIINF